MKRAARLGVMRAGGLVRLGGVTRSHTSHGHYLACPGQKVVVICLNVVLPSTSNIRWCAANSFTSKHRLQFLPHGWPTSMSMYIGYC